MASGHVSAVVRQIERLFTVGTVTGMSEGQLLEQFVSRRDEAAFAALVARHGPMVLGVCRQLLRDPNDVDDAFQATFLVLVRKAGTLRNRDLLGNWLYGVAYKVAQRSRTITARRHATETPDVEDLTMDSFPSSQDLRPWIHDEVQRLPEKYRTPIVLCYLEGLTHEEAAERLRWPLGTVKGRLSRARDLLRSRLTRRGVALSNGLILHQIARDASAVVPNPLYESTIRAATAVASGRGAAMGLVSAQVAALTEGVIHTMFITKLKSIGVSLAVASVVTTSAGVLAYQAPGNGKEAVKSGFAAVVQDAKGPPASAPARVLQKSESSTTTKKLVTGPASTRPTTPDRELSLARKVYDDLVRRYLSGEANDMNEANTWSLRIADAESGSGSPRRSAVQAHLSRLQEFLDAARKRTNQGVAPKTAVDELEYYVVKAERLLEDLNAPKTPQSPASSTPVSAPPQAAASSPAAGGAAGGGGVAGGGGIGGGAVAGGGGMGGGGMGGGGMGGGGMGRGGMGGGGMGGGGVVGIQRVKQGKRVEIARRMEEDGTDSEASAQDKAIRRKLEEPISMSFAEETPLEDVIKYIKSATQGPKDSGIPIYVDPAGLKEAEVTLTSPVQVDLDGVPIKTTLRLLLKQIDLAYCIKDGVLIISSVNGIYNELEEMKPFDDGSQ